MYNIIIGITLLKQLRPYFRKNILSTLESHDFLFLNTLFIAIFVCIYFGYMIATNKRTLNDFFQKYTTLTYWQIISVIILSSLTAISSIILFDFDKNYNTPLINTLIMKGASTLALIIFGVLIYKEKYKIGQLLGFLLIIIGIYLVTQNIF